MSNNTATISRLLNAAGIRKSETGKGKVSLMTSEGFIVTKNYHGETIVKYVPDSWTNHSNDYFDTRWSLAIGRIVMILTRKDYELGYDLDGNMTFTKAAYNAR